MTVWGTRPHTRISVFVCGSFLWEDGVLRRRHGDVSLAVTPENQVEKRCIDRVWPGEIHPGRLRCALPLDRVGLINQSIVPITPVGGKRWLITRPREQGRHDWGIGIV